MSAPGERVKYLAFAALIALSACHWRPHRHHSDGPPPPPIDIAGLPSLSGHPRLWLRDSDVPRLRSSATRNNPLWPPLSNLGASLRRDMDSGALTRSPGCKDERGIYPCEEAGELFAFLSLVSPDEKSRQDYAARAHTILMRVIDAAAKGAADDPIRDPRFPVDDRSRWSGEALPLITDWIYPTLSTADKEEIRTVYLQWCEQLQLAKVTTFNHPEPVGAVDDPRLTEDKQRLRWASNNYFTAHARNMGLMAMALDRADDPDAKLATYLKLSTGSWLYMIDALLREDMRGGLPPEGIEYGPQSLSYVTELLLALHTAKVDSALGPEAQLSSNPFWTDVVNGWFHLQSPNTIAHEWMGPIHQPAWWGDGQHELTPDAIDLFAPIALYDSANNSNSKEHARADAIRWLQLNLPPGKMLERVARVEQYRQAILYFLLFDPAAPAPHDPRPSLATSFVAPGVGRILARSDWSRDAAWLSFGSGWNSVDHQHGDALSFDFYRKGEWLTKERTGYGQTASNSDWHNTLSIENDQPFHAKRDPNDYRALLWKSGSQWLFGAAGGDARIVSHSEDPRYVAIVGDATALYNSTEEGISDVQEATRTLLWLIPDTVIVLDHAVTKTEDRFKRFHLQLPVLPKLDANHAVMTNKSGQRLQIATLLPADAKPTAEATVKSDDAEYDPIRAHFVVESRGRDVRFLHVLQGADAGSPVTWPTLLESKSDVVSLRSGDSLIVLPLVNRDGLANLDVPAFPGCKAVVFTGLVANGAYNVSLSGGRVALAKGGELHADGGGVLWWAAR